MLCRVEQQTQNIRRQLGSADAPVVEKLVPMRPAQLLERQGDRCARFLHEIRKSSRRITSDRLGAKGIFLRVTERLTARVGKETVESAAKVTDMESD